LEEETVRTLAIRVLSRGIGILEFIQSELVADDESDEGPSSTGLDHHCGL